jgi:hypothetical protein
MKSFFLVLFCIAFVSGQSYIKTKVFSEPDCLTDTGAFLSHSVADGTPCEPSYPTCTETLSFYVRSECVTEDPVAAGNLQPELAVYQFFDNAGDCDGL